MATTAGLEGLHIGDAMGHDLDADASVGKLHHRHHTSALASCGLLLLLGGEAMRDGDVPSVAAVDSRHHSPKAGAMGGGIA